MIYIGLDSKTRMVADAEKSFPDEGCGFFYGVEDSKGNRTVTDIVTVQNGKDGDKRKRFEITSQDYLKAEQYANDHDLQLLGVYHSHPDHPPVPSEHDRVAAQPYFSYLIISVLEGKTDIMRCWRLNDESQFEEEFISEKPFA